MDVCFFLKQEFSICFHFYYLVVVVVGVVVVVAVFVVVVVADDGGKGSLSRTNDTYPFNRRSSQSCLPCNYGDVYGSEKLNLFYEWLLEIKIGIPTTTNMAGATRIEINFNRLLGQCQAMAEDKENRDWRFDKYIGSLQNFLVELKKSQSKPSQEILLDYQRKVDLLKGLSEAEKKPSASDRALITERLRPVSTNVTSTRARELQIKAKVRCEEDLRTELFGSPPKSSQSEDDDLSYLRHRRKFQEEKENEEEADIDTILQHHHKIQEKLAEEMLQHTRALKFNITEAGEIIKKDTKTVIDSHSLAEANMDKLKKESERLEAHTKTCSWWIWLMLLFVVITFLGMIPFMRLFSK
ncbi:unconventional SNARE in the ER 1 homolog [Elysia marginata]|uniref:Vesicle transport protein USE1 n=1 Tax=Elysia marginata TaxID=1093978 RepID=A0AAV4HXP5_9GAST|nr:unconventional SNARE in the ER 1 homolog [Elysia marginata]